MAAAAFQETEVGAVSVVDRELSAGRRSAGFAGLATASFLGCIDLTIVTTALPTITRELTTTIGISQLVLTAFLTALAMFMVTAGRLGDLAGRRRVLLAGLAVFVVASVAAALAPARPPGTTAPPAWTYRCRAPRTRRPARTGRR